MSEMSEEEQQMMELVSLGADFGAFPDSKDLEACESERVSRIDPVSDVVDQHPLPAPIPAQTAVAGDQDGLSALQRVLRLMPAEDRAGSLELAQALGVSPGGDEFLYTMLVALGWHKTLLVGLPDELAKRGLEATTKFVQAGDSLEQKLVQVLSDGAASVVTAAHESNVVMQETISQAASQIQLAAAKGAQNAVSRFDISPIVEKIANKTEIALAKKWWSRAAIVASVTSLVLVFGSAYAGYKIGSIGEKVNPKANYYLNQLQCGAVNNALISCRDQFGNIVKFKD